MKESTASLGAITIGLFAAFLLGLEIDTLWAAQMVMPIGVAGLLMITIFSSMIIGLYHPKLSAVLSSIVVANLILWIYITLPLVKQ